MSLKHKEHDEMMAEIFAEDPALAMHLLNDILQDGTQQDLLIALRQMTKAFGGVTRIAEAANLNPTQLYRTLSEAGNPELKSFTAILKAMGMQLSVGPLEARKARTKSRTQTAKLL
jgi:probable addiction module antidote protein